MKFTTPLFALALLPALGCTKPDRTPRPNAPAAAAEPLDAGERSDGWPDADFDDDGSYEMAQGIPEYEPAIPYTAITVPAPTGMEHGMSVELELAEACNLPEPRVYFETDSARLHNDDDRALQTLANCLQQPPLDDDAVMLVGHADPRGSDAYNRELGLERANAVEEAMRELGVKDARITTYSRGEAKASDEQEEWSEDRRVQVRLEG